MFLHRFFKKPYKNLSDGNQTTTYILNVAFLIFILYIFCFKLQFFLLCIQSLRPYKHTAKLIVVKWRKTKQLNEELRNICVYIENKLEQAKEIIRVWTNYDKKTQELLSDIITSIVEVNNTTIH